MSSFCWFSHWFAFWSPNCLKATMCQQVTQAQVDSFHWLISLVKRQKDDEKCLLFALCFEYLMNLFSEWVFLFSQVQLQNLITSKYIGHFLEEVSLWQKKLSVSDSVISIWFEVQRTWSHLESIFIGSEDIRNQLPEDSKRFDGIDVDFKVSEEERLEDSLLIISK